MQLEIPRISEDRLTVSIEMGQQLYVVGANGTGKSALFQHWVSLMDGAIVKRIAAHRQTWLQSASLDFTARNYRDFEQNRRYWDSQEDARWAEQNPAARQSAVLFNLVAKDNARYRIIGEHIDENDEKKAVAFAAKSMPLFRQLNNLLNLGTLKVSLNNYNDEEIMAKHQDNDQSYSMARMSDGERAAAMMAADVLSADSETIFLIDEPERHLHRSIIEPFLSALFSQRPDCAFVISTHEIALPIASPAARIVMLRSCKWQGNQPMEWDTELLESVEHLPEGLKRDILGSRQRILFVEGTVNSLDLPLYSVLFPELSVISKESCDDVIRAVKGLHGSYQYHHVEAFGLIDRDDRTEDEVSELAENNVFALKVYSVESLYYCSDAIDAVARRQADLLGCDADEMISTATQNALKVINDTDNLAERMAARRSERLVYNHFRVQIPDWKEIKTAGEQFTINKPIDNPFQGELDIFKNLYKDGNLDGLIARYPLRESDMFGQIAQALEFKNKENYKCAVIAGLHNNESFACKLKERINPLSELLDDQTVHDS